jgi:hypothetical protein
MAVEARSYACQCLSKRPVDSEPLRASERAAILEGVGGRVAGGGDTVTTGRPSSVCPAQNGCDAVTAVW